MAVWKKCVMAVSCLLIPVLIAFAGELFDSSHDQPSSSSRSAGDSLANLVTDLRKQKKLVGLAAMVMVDGEVMESAVDGERKKGSGVPLEIGDRWHLGSITKSITATMIARLVESGQMQFADTIGECFPDATIHDDWKPVTLKQLLTHTSGATDNFSFGVRLKKPSLGLECTQARRVAVLDVLAKKPETPPGEAFAYSNVGVTIAGAMAEQKIGAAWEDLVQREVFEPLQLNGAGFGPPKSPSNGLPQPRGHLTRLGWKVAATDEMDNTYIMGPAGIVHMTLNDLCSFATEHLRGDGGAGKLLSAKTYELLHTPELDDYACGWVVRGPSEEIPHTVYWHNGSNTMWYAFVAFIPETKLVVAVTSNDGDFESAEEAALEILEASAKKRSVSSDSQPNEPVEGDGPSKKSSSAQELNLSTFAEASKVGMDAFKRKNFDKAIVAWSEAIRLDPNHSEVRRWRGDAWLNKRDPDKAMSEYNEAIQLDPTNGMAFCCRGAAWSEKRERDNAIADFDEAIKLAPEIAKLPFYQIYRKAAEMLPILKTILSPPNRP